MHGWAGGGRTLGHDPTGGGQRAGDDVFPRPRLVLCPEDGPVKVGFRGALSTRAANCDELAAVTASPGKPQAPARLPLPKPLSLCPPALSERRRRRGAAPRTLLIRPPEIRSEPSGSLYAPGPGDCLAAWITQSIEVLEMALPHRPPLNSIVLGILYAPGPGVRAARHICQSNMSDSTGSFGGAIAAARRRQLTPCPVPSRCALSWPRPRPRSRLPGRQPLCPQSRVDGGAQQRMVRSARPPTLQLVATYYRYCSQYRT